MKKGNFNYCVTGYNWNCCSLGRATLPALVVNGISNDMCYSIILKIAIVLGLLLICNITMTYISSIYETYLLNNKMGFLSELFRKRWKWTMRI